MALLLLTPGIHDNIISPIFSVVILSFFCFFITSQYLGPVVSGISVVSVFSFIVLTLIVVFILSAS